jgi:eight-cysteine-cluster-containing protein
VIIKVIISRAPLWFFKPEAGFKRMRLFAIALLLGLIIAGCTQSPPPAQNNTTIIPANNTTNGTVIPPANNTTGIPPGYEVKDYCRIDEDCVRLNKCCDCGLGEYVNIYNQQNPVCEGPQCACPVGSSRGVCEENRCVAVAYAEEHPPEVEEGITLIGSHGGCGAEIVPRKEVTAQGMVINGSISAPDPCHKVVGNVSKSRDLWKIMLSTEPSESKTGYCVACVGTIAWSANITGFYGRVEVYYDGRMVFPDLKSFCGTSTNGTCSSDSDCIRGGCSSQVCQSKFEEPVITTCEWRDCYEYEDVGVSCGCQGGKCQWR